jgi:hypothetical protein
MATIAHVLLHSIERRDHLLMHRVHKLPAPK